MTVSRTFAVTVAGGMLLTLAYAAVIFSIEAKSRDIAAAVCTAALRSPHACKRDGEGYLCAAPATQRLLTCNRMVLEWPKLADTLNICLVIPLLFLFSYILAEIAARRGRMASGTRS